MKHFCALFLLLLFSINSGFTASPLPTTSPRRVGLSPERLETMHRGIQTYIDQGKHAGAVCVIARKGKIADFTLYGYRDLEKKLPMTPDTIFRIYSMSKVITSAAVMQLFEEGKFNLTDPVDRYIPELKNLKVCTGGTVDEPTLVDATNAITIKHLLTHTAGFAYDFSLQEPVRDLYKKADLWNDQVTIKDFIRRLSKLPLVQQ